MHRLCAAWLFALTSLAAPRVAIIADRPVEGPAKHGLTVLESALRGKGLEVADSPDGAAYIISIGPSLLRAWKAPLPQGPESLTVWRGATAGKPALALDGGDSRGLMYALLDTADRISWFGSDPFQFIHNTSEKPYLAHRAVSMYTMQRAYFEQRLYDEHYWERYFDTLAADRFNGLRIVFGYENGGFMAPLYPYFFNVDGFPQVELVGITAAQQQRNTAAFRRLIALAHERGIEITAGIWDHIYRGGVQGGGIPGASQNAGKRVPGLVFGVTTENLSAYTKAALHRFLEVFPELDAIQFRMHDESGLKPEEIQPFWHDVFASIHRDHPNLRLDLRAKGLPDEVIDDALAQGLHPDISSKFWMEQMGLPFHPTHINTEDQKNRRHSYADLLCYPKRYDMHWTLWTGGTARLLLWGDPDYVRRFAGAARIYDGQSIDVNEPLATWMLGEPHDEKPLPIMNGRYRYYEYPFERYWQFYRLFGRLTYDPQTAPEVWEHEFTARFGPQAGPHLMRGLEAASHVLPRIVAASYRYQQFPTTRGWAEMNRGGSLPQYAREEGSDIAQFLSPRDEARSILAGSDTALRRPEETSRWFSQTASQILQEVAAAGSPRGNEFLSTVTDLKILAALARYHSERLIAAVSYNLYKESGSLASFDDAIAQEKKAVEAWAGIVAAAGDVYSENLAFGSHAAGFSRYWKEEYALLQRDFEGLQAERARAAGNPAARHETPRTGLNTPPVVRVTPVSQTAPGRDLAISVQVQSAVPIRWVRLRYRHVTQFEDYQTAEMKSDGKSGAYTAVIPGSFVDPHWDLMYYIEAVDAHGSGRIYPDLEKETPYVIVRVR